MSKQFYLLAIIVLLGAKGHAQQNPDHVFDSTIHTILVSNINNPLIAPVISLQNGGVLKVSFDDFKAGYEDYYYSVELLDSNWKTIDLNDNNYIKGFNQQRISNFSPSSMTSRNYFHYEFNFPNSNCIPTMSGNYIFKVYKGINRDALIFTRRFYVVEDLALVSATLQEPFDAQYSRTHQKINVNVDVKNIPAFQQDQITVKVVQNYRYNDAKTITQPNFIRGSVLVFNNESSLIFPGGNEARWLDLQSLSLKSDRILKIENASPVTQIFLKPDVSRTDLLYAFYKDLNGGFMISNTESLQNETQNDYAKVYFTYYTKDRTPLLDKKLFLSGAFTNNTLDKGAEMVFDVKQGCYQKMLLLKQGYYSYHYIFRDLAEPNDMDDFGETEGNYADTENGYDIFIYYHAIGNRNDQLIGYSRINSREF